MRRVSCGRRPDAYRTSGNAAVHRTHWPSNARMHRGSGGQRGGGWRSRGSNPIAGNFGKLWENCGKIAGNCGPQPPPPSHTQSLKCAHRHRAPGHPRGQGGAGREAPRPQRPPPPPGPSPRSEGQQAPLRPGGRPPNGGGGAHRGFRSAAASVWSRGRGCGWRWRRGPTRSCPAPRGSC